MRRLVLLTVVAACGAPTAPPAEPAFRLRDDSRCVGGTVPYYEVLVHVDRNDQPDERDVAIYRDGTLVRTLRPFQWFWDRLPGPGTVEYTASYGNRSQGRTQAITLGPLPCDD